LFFEADQGEDIPIGNMNQPDRQNNPANNVATPGMPASTTVVVNNTGTPVTIYIAGGTLTAVKVNTTSIGVTAAAPVGSVITVTLAINQNISITYTIAPTWIWLLAQQ
jgi:hypothetical protein